MKLKTELNCLYTYSKQGRFCLCLSDVCLSPTYFNCSKPYKKLEREFCLCLATFRLSLVNFLQQSVKLLVCLCFVSAVIYGFPGGRNHQTFSNASSFFSVPSLLNICCQRRPRVLYSFRFAFQNPHVNRKKIINLTSEFLLLQENLSCFFFF